MPRLATVVTERRLAHGNADHQPEREQRIDDARSKFRRLSIFFVQM